LYLCRELLANSGSIFVQISNENVHRVRQLLDEVFGAINHCADIIYVKTSGAGSPSGGTTLLPETFDTVLWYAREKQATKYRQIYKLKELGQAGTTQYVMVELPDGSERRLTEQEVADPNVLPEGSR